MRKKRPSLFLTMILAGCLSNSLRAEDLPVLPLQRLSLGNRQLLQDSPATNTPVWKSSLNAGFSMTSGNSDTLLVTGGVQTRRKSGPDEWQFGISGAYGENNSEKNRETLQGNGQFSHSIRTQLYDFGRVDGLHDGIKDIKYRFTASIGLGYYLVQQTNTALSLELGPSLVTERQGDQVQTYAAGRVAERFEHKMGSGARLWHRVELIPQLDRMNNYVVNTELGIETAIAKDLALQIYLQDNYVNQPADGYKHNDFRLISGIAYKF